MKIHKTAIVHTQACLAEGAEVGPNTIIGPEVKIGAGTKVAANCVIEGDTTIGADCRIYSGAIIGTAPQDLKYDGEHTRIVIGNNNIIREYVTINLGTKDKGITELGDNNLLMAYAHVAHDCKIGSGVVIANVGTLAGHVTIEDQVVIGGLVAIHQFVRVGKYSIIGGCSKVVQDIPPYVMADGHPAKIFGLNVVGLKRAGMAMAIQQDLKNALHIMFASGIVNKSAITEAERLFPRHKEMDELIAFVKHSKRGLCKSAWNKKRLRPQEDESA